MDDASCFLVIRLRPKTSVHEKNVTVVSTVTGCDVTNCATTLHGFNKHVGTLPYVINYKSESGCKFGEKCVFKHTELDSQPNKKPKKTGGKGSVVSMKKRSPSNWAVCYWM